MLIFLRYLLFIIFLFSFTNAMSLETEWAEGSESKVRIISSISKNDNQSKLLLGLEYKLKKGWKTYWKSPGEGGFPQEINWIDSKNIKSLDIEWPIPENFEILGLKSIGYSNNIIFPLNINLEDPSLPTSVILDINYLTCKDICIPGNAHLELFIPVGKANLTDHSFILEKTISELPTESLDLSFLESFDIDFFSDSEVVSIEFTANAKNTFINPSFFLNTKYGLPVNDPIINLSTNSKKIKVKYIFNKDLIKDEMIDTEIIIKNGIKSFRANKIINVQEKEITKKNSYLFILLIAFIGGLILNGMPCVLPILSIKLISILKNIENKSSIRKSFLITSLGIICSFTLMALVFIFFRYFGYSVGWGMQFQQPFFLMFISLVLTLFTLNLFGFFEISFPRFFNFKFVNNSHVNNNTQDFINGFFATLMATPCSAPFVGTALTFAFTQSYFTMLYIFISMGVGMASPYLFISIFPQLLKFIPKPGRWMIYFKYFLGILLLGTLLWIVKILLNHYNYYFILISLSLLLLAFLINYLFLLKKTLSLIVIIIFFTLPNFSFLKSNYIKEDSNWLDFNSINIDDLIEKDNIIFVDVTADWCATCQFNKINVLNSLSAQEAFIKFKVKKVRADWTKPNKKIEKFLQKNKKFGIPYNVIYNKNNIDGIELSEILSLKMLLETLEKL